MNDKSRRKQMKHNAKRKAHKKMLKKHPENQLYIRVIGGKPKKKPICTIQIEEILDERKPSLLNKIKNIGGRLWKRQRD